MNLPGPQTRAVQSPLLGVPGPAWEKYVAAMAIFPKGYKDVRGRLGCFGLHARKLADAGAMASCHKGRVGTEAGVWLGRWKPPLTEAAFLGSMPLQYAVFVRLQRAAAAAPEVSRHVGSRVDTASGITTCSLSGLLGVAHAAGIQGVPSWLSDPAVRRRFSRTTEAFVRTNGIF